MENLEKSILERLCYCLLFYIRYIDDTLLYVTLDKLQKNIDSFNDYHPKIQFRGEPGGPAQS